MLPETFVGVLGNSDGFRIAHYCIASPLTELFDPQNADSPGNGGPPFDTSRPLHGGGLGLTYTYYLQYNKSIGE